MPNIQTIVEMDDYAFTSNPDETLYTHGITTCIAFVIRGFYINDETEEETPFCGLYHASDFLAKSSEDESEDEDESGDESEYGYTNKDHDCADEIFTDFLRNLREDLSIDRGIMVHIKSLLFIGGEKKELNANNEITLSGTEAEVESLKHVIPNFKFGAMNFISDDMVLEHKNYLTSGNSSISIELTINECRTLFCNPHAEEEPGSPGLGV